MTKTTGLGDHLLAGGFDVSGDIGSLGKIGGGVAALDFTGIDKSAFERLGGLRDGGIDFTAFFNPGVNTNAAHARFAALPTADQTVTYCRGLGLGSPAASTIGKQIDYAGKRGNDGQITFDISVQSAAGTGLEWGRQATAGLRTDTAATNGAALDNTVTDTSPSLFGLQAYLQVLAFTGTSCTIKLQDSPDSAAWTDVVGGSFGAQTAIGTARLATSGTLSVARFLRVATTGTFSSCQFLVQVSRNSSATAF